MDNICSIQDWRIWILINNRRSWCYLEVGVTNFLYLFYWIFPISNRMLIIYHKLYQLIVSNRRVIAGFLWLLVFTCDYLWLLVTTCEYLWLLAIAYDYLWLILMLLAITCDLIPVITYTYTLETIISWRNPSENTDFPGAFGADDFYLFFSYLFFRV